MGSWEMTPEALTVCLCTAKPEQALKPPLVSSALLQPRESPVRWRAMGVGGSLRALPQLSTLLHPSRRRSLNSPAPSFP